jgi:hypothetical protein
VPQEAAPINSVETTDRPLASQGPISDADFDSAFSSFVELMIGLVVDNAGYESSTRPPYVPQTLVESHWQAGRTRTRPHSTQQAAAQWLIDGVPYVPKAQSAGSPATGYMSADCCAALGV